MRRFVCHICESEITFASAECDVCGAGLGFFPSTSELLPLKQVGPVEYTTATSGPESTASWRCLNFAWGCNWMLPSDSGNVWCASCRLTRGRPDESAIDAVLAWSTVEQAKRRLVYQLGTLDLPIHGPLPDTDDGVVFDLVYLPDSPGVTGHRAGVVTIDLREVDDRFRESARVHFDEPDRTVLGHLRHEIGHHYWHLLVERGGTIDTFRALFGDERADYRDALADHYEHLGRAVPDTHISSYATAHPSEDWAETFAHYLQMRDGLETAEAFGLAPAAVHPESMGSMLQRWRHLATAVNEINLGLGHAAPYPFTITRAVEPKLEFVDAQINRAARARPRASAEADSQ
jgi:hypothetical protein